MARPVNRRGFFSFDPPTLMVDFNGLGYPEEGQIDGLRLTGIAPEPGELVWLKDYEGNSCLGTLIRRAGRGGALYECRVDLTTWRDGNLLEEEIRP